MQQSSSHPRHFIIGGILTFVSTIVIFLLLRAGLPLPEQASTQAVIIDRLIGGHLFMIALLFSVVVVFMLYAIVVFRKREGDEEDGEHFEGNSTLEMAWTGIPAIFVIVFIVLGIWTLNIVMREQPEEMVLKIIGQQWSWSFEYEEGLMVYSTTPDSVVVLPVNQPMRMEMNSSDVLHAFWVPEFRVKQDLVPGQETIVRFTPTKTGDYKLRCAELCGLNHYGMLATFRVVEQDEYEQWLSEAMADFDPSLAQQTDDIQ
ncbi:cytochrome c oxidase subunit II [Chloroflexi bacterium TSY]|nr:cytochrome c oxidase subunit II [Chloroflexi bacterium TSY]